MTTSSMIPPTPAADRAATGLVTARALADPLRLRIVELLATEQLCVNHLAVELQAPQPLVSHHLKVLREAGLVATDRYRYWTYYRLRPAAHPTPRRPPTGSRTLQEGSRWQGITSSTRSAARPLRPPSSRSPTSSAASSRSRPSNATSTSPSTGCPARGWSTSSRSSCTASPESACWRWHRSKGAS